MHLNFALVLGSVVIGFLVGLTGMGGGALMTPMLVLLFGVAPSAAISSDLIAALFMKPLGVAVHWHKKTIQPRLVRYLCYGSAPAAILGTYVMHLLGSTKSAEHRLQLILGVALLVGAAAMIARAFFPTRQVANGPLRINRPLIIGVGVFGGFMVGLTSVGAGSLIIVMLLLIYPHMRTDQLVGTDLAQSLPLTGAATLGTLLFGHVQLGLTASIIVGSVPAVILGSFLSARSFTTTLRPYLGAVALLSGLKYVGLPDDVMGVAAILVFGVATLVALRSAHGAALDPPAILMPSAHDVASDIAVQS
ncbi:MAG: sulfite exporter TauE/SafE family protein [Acidimicrobiaceae bacterium]|nr:sulfite exporter TauE/SafE family protein [Acidimicrobiaceae bacterium]